MENIEELRRAIEALETAALAPALGTTALGTTSTAGTAAGQPEAVIAGDVVALALAALRRELQALESAAPLPQRKQVTALFADLVGFTSLSETLDPETATEMLNLLWADLDAVIVAHGGFIDKHMGDGVMALWGGDANARG